MRVPRFLLSSAAIACCLSLPAIAEPTNAELDQRLRAVEGNIQTILELLKAQQANPAAEDPANTKAAADAAGAPSGYQWGVLFMDVFSNPVSRDEGNALFKQGGPSAPSNAPLASVSDKPPSIFAGKQVMAYPETARFDEVDGNLQIQWSGVFEAKNSGEHIFFLDLMKNQPRPLQGPSICRSVLRSNDEIIVDLSFTYGPGYEDFASSKQGAIGLAPGVYDFSVFLTCWGGRDAFIEAVEAGVRLMEPGERSPKPISPDRLGIRL